MDKTTETLVSYALSFSRSDLTPAVLDAARDRLFDTVAVAIAGSDTEAAHIAARISNRGPTEPHATIFGFGVETAPELAAFANTIMVRAYDYNDAGAGHPSDMISGVLAAGEIAHASGIDVLSAITLAYEVNGGLFSVADPYFKGFDQGLFPQVAVALAAGRLWNLNGEQLANAASIALVPNIPLRIAREGPLSMMKGSVTGFATRNGVFAALLAREGFTSCPEPYEGYKGLWESVTGPFELHLPVEPHGLRVIQKTAIKPFPAAEPILGLLGLIPKIRSWAPIADIASIHVEMVERYVAHLADDSKYDPRNRETADHSVPYLLARGLVDGDITFLTYRPERICDPALRPLMRKVTVAANPEYTHQAHQNKTVGATMMPANIRIRTHSGREFFEEVTAAKGHITNPMTREDLNAKFNAICSPVLSVEQRERIRAKWWNVAQANDISAAIQTLTGFRTL